MAEFCQDPKNSKRKYLLLFIGLIYMDREVERFFLHGNNILCFSVFVPVTYNVVLILTILFKPVFRGMQCFEICEMNWRPQTFFTSYIG